MRYRDISLTDFGIYQNARIDDLPDGIGVIAGPQRAGKTTFMHALRQFPFGIGRGNGLPPASQEYELGATITHDGADHSLRVSGHKAPRVGALDEADELTRSDLVGGLSRDQYQQLFTLSLRELQRMPEGLDDEEQLSEILLGAAYGDISEVPALRERFARDAHSIGGKYGRAVSRLGDLVDRIDDAVDARDAAKRTVDQYETTQTELQEVDSVLEELAADEEELEAERTRLSILDKWFADLERYREARAELEDLSEPTQEYPDDASDVASELGEELDDATAAVDDARSELATYTDDQSVDAFGRRLLDASSTIERYDRRVEKWRDQEATLADTRAELEGRRRQLVRRVESLRSDWSALDRVRDVTADTLTKETVRRQTTRVEDLRGTLEETEREVRSTEREIEKLEADLEAAEDEVETGTDDPGSSSRAPLVGAGIALLGLAIGGGVGLVTTPLAGYAVAAVGILAGFLYVRRRVQSPRTDLDVEPVRELRGSISNRRSELNGLTDEIEALETDLETAEAEIDALREQFDLPGDVPPSGVREFYDQFETLRSDVRTYDGDLRRHAEDEQAFDATLNDVADDLDGLAEFEWDRDSPRTRSDELYAAVERAADAVAAAENLSDARDSLAEARADTIAVLAPWEPADRADHSTADLELLSTPDLVEELEAYGDAAGRANTYRELETETETIGARIRREFHRSTVVEAFQPIRSELDPADAASQAASGVPRGDSPPVAATPALEHLADRYATDDEIASRMDEIDRQLDDLRAERDELRDRRAEITETLKTLASDDDLQAAETEIQRHRERLRSLGEEYAVNRMAETLLDELHDQFLEEATGPLLDEASDIFSRLTETYDGVIHAGDLDSLRFEALRPDGSNRGPDSLSRATAEQLFLSIRLARIRQFDESLPVVIDDAMTNFDPAHTRRAIGFLDELARTHQILLLTCHPEVIRLAAQVADVDGYWQLDDGQFEGPTENPEPGMQFLEADRETSHS